MVRFRIFARLCLVVLACSAAPARAVELYDGALNTLPAAQGWRYVTNPLGGASAVQSVAGGLTTLDTTAVTADMAGYFSQFPILGAHPLMPVLNRAAGYTIRFDVRLASETHVSNDRAGFSLIALASDSRGLELGFWSSEIWAQADSPLFTHGEGVAFDTMAAVRRYDLAVLGNDYDLFADGARILEGTLRDYTSFGFPYNLSSFLFLGDDTSSAAANVQIGRIEVLPFAVPEPEAWFLAALGALLLTLLAGRRTKVAEFARIPMPRR